MDSYWDTALWMYKFKNIVDGNKEQKLLTLTF